MPDSPSWSKRQHQWRYLLRSEGVLSNNCCTFILEDEDFYADAEDGSGDGHRGQLIMNNLTNQLNGAYTKFLCLQFLFTCCVFSAAMNNGSNGNNLDEMDLEPGQYDDAD